MSAFPLPSPLPDPLTEAANARAEWWFIRRCMFIGEDGELYWKSRERDPETGLWRDMDAAPEQPLKVPVTWRPTGCTVAYKRSGESRRLSLGCILWQLRNNREIPEGMRLNYRDGVVINTAPHNLALVP